MNDKIIIDGHAHACGEYLTKETIVKKLSDAKADMVLLTPGQYKSRITYKLKNLAERNPLGDVVSKNNRTTSLLISLIGAIKDIPKGNEYVYQLKCMLPDKIRQCYWVTRSNAEIVRQDYERMKFDAVKFHQCWEKFDLNDVFFVKTIKWAAENKIPVFIHARNISQVQNIISFIKENPKAIVIVGHLYGAELFMREDKNYFANTYFDLSNLYFVSKERTMAAYRHFGAEHLIMGSDTPYGVRALEKTIKQIYELEIPSEDKYKILGGNLARLLNL